MTTALLDGDVIAYKAAALCQDEVIWEEGDDPDIQVDIPRGFKICRHLIDHLCDHVGAKEYRIALSHRELKCFRYQVHPHYKNQRTSAKPQALAKMEEYLVKRHDAETRPYLEGDDLLGIWQTTPGGSDTIIVSPDKDMLTVPGRVFIVPHMADYDTSPIKDVTKREALDNLFLQTLKGDTVDNYLGAPGVGAKGAVKWLEALRDNELNRWETILDAYEWAWEKRPRFHDRWVHPGEPGKEALMNLRCARILQHGDYEYNKGVRLWSPKGEEEWLSL